MESNQKPYRSQCKLIHYWSVNRDRIHSSGEEVWGVYLWNMLDLFARQDRHTGSSWYSRHSSHCRVGYMGYWHIHWCLQDDPNQQTNTRSHIFFSKLPCTPNFKNDSEVNWVMKSWVILRLRGWFHTVERSHPGNIVRTDVFSFQIWFTHSWRQLLKFYYRQIFNIIDYKA